jgi:hypothetical protein
MKAKLYSLSLLAGLGFAFSAKAQCTVTYTYTTNGLTIAATATGTGMATIPTYGWDWGDSNIGIGQTQNHTYSAAGTYVVCAYYFDLADTASCNAISCQSITVSAVGIAENTPTTLNVSSSPNPFSETAHINVNINRTEDVEVAVYDMTGKEVAKLHEGQMQAGLTVINWTPEELAAGVYFVRVKSGGSIQTMKIVHTVQK